MRILGLKSITECGGWRDPSTHSNALLLVAGTKLQMSRDGSLLYANAATNPGTYSVCVTIVADFTCSAKISIAKISAVRSPAV